MSHVERSAVRDDQVDLLLTKFPRGRGDKVKTPTLTNTIRSPLEGVIAAEFEHWAGQEDTGPSFELQKNKPQVKINHRHGKHVSYEGNVVPGSWGGGHVGVVKMHDLTHSGVS